MNGLEGPIKIIVYFLDGRYHVSRRDCGTPHDRLSVVFWLLAEVSYRKNLLRGHVFSADDELLREVKIKKSKRPVQAWDAVVLEEAHSRGIAHLEEMRQRQTPLTHTG